VPKASTSTALRKLTLNNNRQDPGNLVHQCLGYGVFAAAGVPAPRCNVAAVSVNGVPLGVYTHVEPVGEPMLGLHFADDERQPVRGRAQSTSATDGSARSSARPTRAIPIARDLEAVRRRAGADR
jgi:hypothetical protein